MVLVLVSLASIGGTCVCFGTEDLVRWIRLLGVRRRKI